MDGKKTFRDLIAWRKSIELTKVVYETTNRMPQEERFGLISQMRRAVVSVASNIAEGNARGTLKDYIRFLVMARGSLAELETQMTIAEKLGMTTTPHLFWDRFTETDRLVQGLIRSLKNKQTSTATP